MRRSIISGFIVLAALTIVLGGVYAASTEWTIGPASAGTASASPKSARANLQARVATLQSQAAALADASPGALGISEQLHARARSLEQASRNTSDAISMVDTAEGALDEVSAILARMRELADQSANGTYTETDRTAMDMDVEFEHKLAEITRIAHDTTFNGIALLSSEPASFSLQVGAGTNSGVNTIILPLADMRLIALGIDSANIGTASDARQTQSALNRAKEHVRKARKNYRKVQQRLETKVRQLEKVLIQIKTTKEKKPTVH